MDKRAVGLSLFAGSVFTVSPAQADFTVGGINIGIQPRINGGAMYYEYSQPTVGVERAQANLNTAQLEDDVNQIFVGFGLAPGSITSLATVSPEQSFETSTWLPTLGGGATLFVDRFYVDGYAQHAFTGNDKTSQDQDTAISLFSQATGEVGGTPTRLDLGAAAFSQVHEAFDVDIDRTEWSISAGYAVTENFSVYAGYKSAETAFKQRGKQGVVQQQITTTAEAFDGNTGAPITDPITGNPVTVGETVIQTGTLSRDVEREFEYDGPFIGAVYGVPINKGFLDGIMAFNLAIAFLDGEVTETERNRVLTLDGQTSTAPERKAIIEGNTTGLTLGLSWKGSTPIEGLSYLVGVDGYKYDFSGDKVKLQGQTIHTDTQIDETVINIRVGASYIF